MISELLECACLMCVTLCVLSAAPHTLQLMRRDQGRTIHMLHTGAIKSTPSHRQLWNVLPESSSSSTVHGNSRALLSSAAHLAACSHRVLDHEHNHHEQTSCKQTQRARKWSKLDPAGTEQQAPADLLHLAHTTGLLAAPVSAVSTYSSSRASLLRAVSSSSRSGSTARYTMAYTSSS